MIDYLFSKKRDNKRDGLLTHGNWRKAFQVNEILQTSLPEKFLYMEERASLKRLLIVQSSPLPL